MTKFGINSHASSNAPFVRPSLWYHGSKRYAALCTSVTTWY